MDAYRCILIANNIQAIPLALQITHICGNIMSKTLQGGRAERNSYLLLHAFHEEGYFYYFTKFIVITAVLGHLPPEKLSLKAKKAVSENEKGEEKTGKEKKKAKYAGGLGVFSNFFVFGPHSRVHTFSGVEGMNLFVLLDACQNSDNAFFEVKPAFRCGISFENLRKP